MSIEHAILGLLDRQPLSGYDLKRRIADSYIVHWSGNNNQIYTTLVQLHRAGFVKRARAEASGGPARHVYSITAQGRAELKRWVLAPPELPELRHPFLTQLAWADQLSPGELDALLARYEDEAANRLVLLQGQDPRWDSAAPGDAYAGAAQARTPREALLWTALAQHGIAFYENELRWVRATRQALRSRRAAAARAA